VFLRVTPRLFFYPGENVMPFLGMMCGNTYVIRGRGGRLVIVDPGPSIGPHLPNVRRAMLHDGMYFRNIESIVISHQHPDHAWAAPSLAVRTGAEILCSEKDMPVVLDPGRLWYDEERELGGFQENVLPLPAAGIEALSPLFFGPSNLPPRTPGVLFDGDTIDLGGTVITVLETPGHRPGEIALHIPQDDVVVTGDIINRRRWDIPSINFPMSDLNDTAASIEKIRSLDPTTICNGHEHFVSGRPLVRKWLREVLDRCATLRETAAKTISANPGITLPNLGLKLIAGNREISFMEIRAIAYVTLKSFPEGRAWLSERRAN